jgi:hypothetical protein
MIDTDKYEGHTPACDWEIHLADALFETEFPMTYADNQLMADAPLLLAEVKQLREQFLAYQDFLLWVEEEHNEVFDQYERKDEL